MQGKQVAQGRTPRTPLGIAWEPAGGRFLLVVIKGRTFEPHAAFTERASPAPPCPSPPPYPPKSPPKGEGDESLLRPESNSYSKLHEPSCESWSRARSWSTMTRSEP